MTKRLAVIGWPVGHSRSPAMQNAALAAASLTNWHYGALAVEPENLESTVRALPEQGFVGVNVTIPHKVAALALADEASDTAAAIGAANTLTFASGRIEAANTDPVGILGPLAEVAPGSVAGSKALILGAGGAARAAVFAIGQAGAAEIQVWNRTPERADQLTQVLGPVLPETTCKPIAKPNLADVDLIVNSTAVGLDSGPEPLAGGDSAFKELQFSADELEDRHIVVDLAYRAGGTPLVLAARRRGLRCVDGVDVLVHQGAESFYLWTGQRPSLEAMRLGAGDRTADRSTAT